MLCCSAACTSCDDDYNISQRGTLKPAFTAFVRKAQGRPLNPPKGARGMETALTSETWAFPFSVVLLWVPATFEADLGEYYRGALIIRRVLGPTML